mmetsp:Transcript_21744/g.67000  ORF Transcript_21744/g.67000 Transcript_21744/m.67000 type:complete len:235 (-) Transcript_21744:318-1022(-)
MEGMAGWNAAAGGHEEGEEHDPEVAEQVAFALLGRERREHVVEAPEAGDEVQDEEVALGGEVEDRRQFVEALQEVVVVEPGGSEVKAGVAGIDDFRDLPLEAGLDELGPERVGGPAAFGVRLDVRRKSRELVPLLLREPQHRLQGRRAGECFRDVAVGSERDVAEGLIGQALDDHGFVARREGPAQVDDAVRQGAHDAVRQHRRKVRRDRPVHAQLGDLLLEVAAELGERLLLS